MFENKTEHAAVKVIDFGLSKKFIGKAEYMTERVGTIYTMAPQVLQGVYSSQADLWSLGVLAYMLLSSTKPFYAKRRRVMIDRIMTGRACFDTPVWQNISDDAKDFVRRLLVVDPKERMNAAQCMKHTWIVNREKLPDDIPSEQVLSALDDSLLHYRQTSQLKKLALTVIAHRSTAKDIMLLRKVFDSLDTEKDGKLSYDEFKRGLEKMNYTEKELDEIFSSIVCLLFWRCVIICVFD
jgi:serine/threonine protein kinase